MKTFTAICVLFCMLSSTFGWKETGGSIPSTQPRPNQNRVTKEDLKIPKAITFPLDLGYDYSLYAYFGSHQDTKQYIQKIVSAAIPFFNLPRTGLPIITWELGNIEYFDISINADQLCYNNNKQKEVEKLRRGNSVPLMLFVEDRHPQDTEQTTGCAFDNAAYGNTQGQAFGIVDMSRDVSDNQNIQLMAKTMAHEFGHLIGMAHDHIHDPKDGCNHQGLMSYDIQPETWSTCSVKDFKQWWRTTGFHCKELKKPYDNPNDGSIIPKTITFPLDLGYDKRLYDQFGSHSSTRKFIQQIFDLASTFFKQPHNTGLPTISWDLGNIKPYFDISINADQLCSNYDKQKETKKLRKGTSTPLILFVEDLQAQGTQAITGCAYTGAACGNNRGQALGIVDMTHEGYNETQHMQHMARSMAHEFGHMIGMLHDVAHGSGCYGTGLMSYGGSYGENIQDKWSTCSVNDFEKWWRRTGFACKEITT